MARQPPPPPPEPKVRVVSAKSIDVMLPWVVVRDLLIACARERRPGDFEGATDFSARLLDVGEFPADYEDAALVRIQTTATEEDPL